MSAATVQELAGVAYDAFERRTRDDGSVFVTLRDEAPDWVQPIVRAAHGDMLPDDFAYEACRDAFGWIHDNDGDEDGAGEFADENVSAYTRDLLAWVSSNLERVGYCDEAAEEFGDDGKGGLVRLLSLGQYLELSNIYGEVYRGLVDAFDELDQDDDEEEA